MEGANNWKCVCGEEFPTRKKLIEHRKKCDKAYINRANSHIEAICPFCGLQKVFTTSSFSSHKNHCKENPNRKEWVGHPVSEETKKKLSVFAKKSNMGGYRKGSGRGKKGYYKGIWCDSSWELAYVIYNLEHGIPFQRNTEKFKYLFEGEEHDYLPDFKEGDKFIEIKGYYTDQVFAKAEQFPYELIFIDKKTIKPYTDYVENKYGKDFIKLYDNGCEIVKKSKPNKILKKDLKKDLKKQKADKMLENGQVDSIGRLSGTKLPIEELEKRKEMILKSGVDLFQYGWINKVSKITGLTRRQISLVVDSTNIECFKRK